MPVGPLMTEHRLIERMISLMAKEVRKIKESNAADPEFISIAVDFIRTYADKLHHGKEEDIFFRDLSKKALSAEHKKTMDELVEEHALARKNTKDLFEARNKYARGDKDSLEEIARNMEILAQFYPKHIEKEDKHFFLPVMNYFSKEEQSAMLDEFYEFDRQFIHSKYNNMVSGLDGIKKKMK